MLIATDQVGRILHVIFDPVPDGYATNFQNLGFVTYPDQPALIAPNIFNIYMKNGVQTLRPASTIALDKTSIKADNTDKATITGLPNPSTVYVNEQAVTVTDEKLELTSTQVGTLSLRCEPFPQLPWTSSIQVVAP